MRYDEAIKSINRYVEQKIPTGDFLRACLENDLSMAVGRADDTSIHIIPEIVRYIYNEIPGVCHGSKEKVQEWLKRE